MVWFTSFPTHRECRFDIDYCAAFLLVLGDSEVLINFRSLWTTMDNYLFIRYASCILGVVVVYGRFSRTTVLSNIYFVILRCFSLAPRKIVDASWFKHCDIGVLFGFEVAICILH